ncbi:MAG: hypothetical protein EF812_07330 [Methanosarcinales archaeon]|nr:MAG: hypothetical protein EF812_07330 [Methanosarcinales archaeon]
MSSIEIPPFVKNMGHKILAYMLNINDQNALELTNGNFDLDENQLEVFKGFIQICRQLRIQSIDQGDVDSRIMYSLPEIFLGEKHLFNVWREQLGGKLLTIETEDKVVNLASCLALELYPLFLIKPPRSRHHFANTFSHISLALYKLSAHKELYKEILKDDSLKKIFSNIGENDMDTTGSYMASTGLGGGIQLSVFPERLISNAYELIQLHGLISQEALLQAIEQVINMVRDVANGKTIHVPVFVGFQNLGLENIDLIDIEWGKIRGYNPEMLDLIPQEARPSSLGGENKTLGFILESEYPYKVDFSPQNEDKCVWPPELEQARNKLDNTKENLSLIFALAIERDPPVGINVAWTLIFDPMSLGANISWPKRTISPMPYYLLSSDSSESVKYWSSIITSLNDNKIRIAIRRILSSINERANPIDGFVDSIIAWENLFGANAELSYRISISISKLLKASLEDRLKLQKEIVDFYNDRSKIVHGSKEISYEDAEQKRNECLQIALCSLRKLYENHQELIEDIDSTDRSKKLALM